MHHTGRAGKVEPVGGGRSRIRRMGLIGPEVRAARGGSLAGGWRPGDGSDAAIRVGADRRRFAIGRRATCQTLDRITSMSLTPCVSSSKFIDSLRPLKLFEVGFLCACRLRLAGSLSRRALRGCRCPLSDRRLVHHFRPEPPHAEHSGSLQEDDFQFGHEREHLSTSVIGRRVARPERTFPYRVVASRSAAFPRLQVSASMHDHERASSHVRAMFLLDRSPGRSALARRCNRRRRLRLLC